MCAAILTEASYVVGSYRSGTPQCVRTHTEKDALPLRLRTRINHLLKRGCYFVYKERRYVHERSGQKKALRVGGIDDLAASFDSSHQTMTQLSTEICSLSPHYPQAHSSSLILDGLESPHPPLPRQMWPSRV